MNFKEMCVGRAVAVFEKVSLKQFMEDDGFREQYSSIVLPTRATAGSAGYDFILPMNVILNPGESYVVPTGIRCRIAPGYVLMIYPRSGLGFKYFLRVANTVGIIDSDYYGASNEGHILVKLHNSGSRCVILKAGDRFCQGVFTEYFVTIDDYAEGSRTGGFGSTDKQDLS